MAGTGDRRITHRAPTYRRPRPPGLQVPHFVRARNRALRLQHVVSYALRRNLVHLPVSSKEGASSVAGGARAAGGLRLSSQEEVDALPDAFVSELHAALLGSREEGARAAQLTKEEMLAGLDRWWARSARTVDWSVWTDAAALAATAASADRKAARMSMTLGGADGGNSVKVMTPEPSAAAPADDEAPTEWTPSADEALALSRIGFLLMGYRQQAWYWEIVELCRRLLLTAVLALVRPGTLSQVVFSVMLTFAGAILFSLARPYAQTAANRLAVWAEADLFLLAFIALLLKANISDPGSSDATFSGICATLAVLVPAIPVVQLFVTIGGWLLRSHCGGRQ